MRDYIPFVNAMLYWKAKFAKQLHALHIVDADIQDIRQLLPCMARILWLVVRQSTMLFTRSAQTFVFIIAVHHYGSSLYYQICYLAPDWLTELAGMHGTAHSAVYCEDVEPPPSLELDHRLSRVEGSHGDVLRSKSGNNVISNASTSSHNAVSPSNKLNLSKTEIFVGSLNAATESRPDTQTNSNHIERDNDKVSKVRFSDRVNDEKTCDKQVNKDMPSISQSAQSSSTSNSAQSTNRWVFDPQFGVVTEECRDKWRQTQRANPTKSSRPLPPVRFT